MFEQIEIMRMAKELAVHAAARQSIISSNVANADTPGFKAGDLRSFSETYRSSDREIPMRASRPGHVMETARSAVAERVPDLNAEPSPNGNTVSLETELVRSASAKRQHDVSLAVYRTSLDILRSALGRGR
jgi:flagellar basal-body rod protein FlgB